MQRLRQLCNINKIGVSLLGITEAAEKVGFRTVGAKIELEQLQLAQLPCIIHWNQNHFVVLYKVKKQKFYVSDPGKGLITYSTDEFVRGWKHQKQLQDGIVLFITPTPQFYAEEGDVSSGLNWTILLNYRKTYHKLLLQLFFGLIIGSLIQLIGPFLTQALVDTGINTKNLSFVNVILIAQLMLFIGSMSIGFIRSWIMLHMTTRINVSILTDFLAKLMRLPMSFFDTKRTGDIMQRMNDHYRVESFLTGSTLDTLFSLLNLIIYAIVVGYYSGKILLIFAITTVIYTAWVLLFMGRRRELDQKRFDNSSDNHSNMVELIAGIQEIKLHNCEHQKRWQWENIQAKLFKFNIKSLALSQYQQAGASFINQGKNIFISYISAKAVIYGDLTLGGMMALQYMAGQLNAYIYTWN